MKPGMEAFTGRHQAEQEQQPGKQSGQYRLTPTADLGTAQRHGRISAGPMPNDKEFTRRAVIPRWGNRFHRIKGFTRTGELPTLTRLKFDETV